MGALKAGLDFVWEDEDKRTEVLTLTVASDVWANQPPRHDGFAWWEHVWPFTRAC